MESHLYSFLKHLGRDTSDPVQAAGLLYEWSIREPRDFWRECLSFCNLLGNFPADDPILLEGARFQDAKWFPQSSLNFAENLLAPRENRDAIVFWGEDQIKRHLSHQELREMVSGCQRALSDRGVIPGDRIAAVLPNLPESIVAMLAATSLGAVWTSCSPDFGVPGLLDRLSQVEPKVLFCCDGYYYKGNPLPILEKIEELVKQIPSVRHVVVCPYIGIDKKLNLSCEVQDFEEFTGKREVKISFQKFPFSHPLYILYSSGTTGKPKCIVHSAGGTLLEHKKELLLHTDVKPSDTLFYHTTCGWMMWNWLVSGLSTGAKLALYDGAPFHLDGRILFKYAEEEKISIFGTSAKFLSALEKSEVRPREEFQLNSLRTVLSTGSPLSPESFDFVYRDIKSDVCLSSIAGGTDIVGCFGLGNPLLPVYRGELQCRSLGYDVQTFDDTGEAVTETQGELVCAKPFPSMPVGFWNDSDGARYQGAYFERFPNIWHHGDFVTLTERGGLIFHGRSDSTLNPGGIRIGTSEIYRQVEQIHSVEESVVVGQEWEDDVRVVLFVKLRQGHLTDELKSEICTRIRNNTSPFHVPKVILQVEDIPRTRSGKISEIAVREAIHGRPLKNTEALVNPESLEEYRKLSSLTLARR
ncbi:MAG: acetoacetate--CoA ligase [Bdellovibrionales bacterium]|nr:acetoacetate--CoA ligase [Bdellovibrionales bacterium]